MNEVTEKPHVSNTQLDMYWRCAEQYRRRYIEGERLPPAIAMLQGRAVHAGAEHNFKQKIESHEDVPKQEIVDATVAAFETDLADGYALDDFETKRGASVVIGEAKDLTARLGLLHAVKQAPEYQPIEDGVERWSRLEFPEATHDLVTVIDLIDDQDRVTDFKTAGKSKPASDVDKSVQLTIYAAQRQAQTGKLPKEVRLDNLIKTKKPKRQLLRSERTPKDIEILVNRINATLAGINAGIFAPCSPGSTNCSSRWCGFWTTCPYVNSQRIASAEAIARRNS